MVKHRAKANFNLLSGFDGYAPAAKGVIALLLWFLVGVILGNIVNFVIIATTPSTLINSMLEYSMLVIYPLMFIPAMMWAGFKSRQADYDFNAVKPEPIDQSNFGSLKALPLALMVMVVTLAAQMLCDNFGLWMPAVPEGLKSLFESMTQGNIWLNLLLVSIFAPFFEEWLCRGMILRGLKRTKIGATGAIVVSALIFALIHGNPWQALPAFVLGVIFGYVYHKTGSLKLTMLMHFTNNTFAVLMGQFAPELSEYDSLAQVIPAWQYICLVGASAVLIVMFIRILYKGIPSTEKE